ncbi:ATP-binding protein [Oceanisphaera pacifica]|uniref:histidine kinase n=1 Tax=Oceanisphaera pacifica TaxID=2818389 RepID=A0ABS3NIV4_9GAMM|nr:ATP-binding protein [Oceanisphaera pacifica]MBO1520521.1 HAMP domain-containing protein [Oceanisphaera pacifica]
MGLSLKGRISLIILATALLTVLAILVMSYQILGDDLEQQIRQQQMIETNRDAEQVQHKLALRLAALMGMSSQLTNGTQLNSVAKINEKIQRHALLQSYFPDGLLVLNQQGTAIAESLFVPHRLGTNYADVPHIKQALKTRKPVISHPVIGRKTGMPLISFVNPILGDDGQLLGILIGVINLSKASLLPQQRLAAAQQRGVEFKIIDAQSLTFIYNGTHPEKGIQPLPPPLANPLVDAALSGFNVGVVEKGEQRWVYANTHLNQLGWVFVRAVPYEQAIGPAKALLLDFASISILMGAILALAAFGLAWSAMRPLATMTQQIRTMSSQSTNNSPLPETGVREVAQLAQAFNQLVAERKALSAVKDDFVAVISHELRTPLTSINGALKLMHSGVTGPLPEKADELTVLALRNGERLQHIINDLLDINKLSAGKMQLAIEPCCITELVDEAIAANQPMAQEYQVQLRAQANQPYYAETDLFRFRQVLDNLLSNAIKFSPKQAVVTATTELTPCGRLRVSDQGSGIPAAFRDSLFERFAQAECGTMRANKGTGLGLTISKELITLMGGQIGFYNDKGAHLWVELPLRLDHTRKSEGQSDV